MPDCAFNYSKYHYFSTVKSNIPQCALRFVLKIFQADNCVIERGQDKSTLDLRGDLCDWPLVYLTKYTVSEVTSEIWAALSSEKGKM